MYLFIYLLLPAEQSLKGKSMRNWLLSLKKDVQEGNLAYLYNYV